MLLVQSKNKVYGFPKGKIHEGEQAPQCAQREVEEEIGVKIQVDPRDSVQVEMSVRIGNKTVNKICKFFICRIEKSCVVPRKCLSLEESK